MPNIVARCFRLRSRAPTEAIGRRTRTAGVAPRPTLGRVTAPHTRPSGSVDQHPGRPNVGRAENGFAAHVLHTSKAPRSWARMVRRGLAVPARRIPRPDCLTARWSPVLAGARAGEVCFRWPPWAPALLAKRPFGPRIARDHEPTFLRCLELRRRLAQQLRAAFSVPFVLGGHRAVGLTLQQARHPTMIEDMQDAIERVHLEFAQTLAASRISTPVADSSSRV